MNHTPMRSLAGHSPAELFTGLHSPSSFDVVVRPTLQREELVIVDLMDVKTQLEKLRVSLEGLWSRIDERLPNNKLLRQWMVPFRIIKALPHAFNTQHLVTNKVYEVHGTRLKVYADADLDMNVEMQELVTSQGIVLDVADFVDHRYNALLGRWELLVRWAGLQPIENSWESFEVMQKDVPQAVLKYVESAGEAGLGSQLS
ncbi:hypothetical protein PHMEG_00019701 [Phytophthora megakarya]|uniref:Chromo domain-containing protein n=1 Tax=Phytophthora megakarya TaxID=4795 RepID=A0A225VST7_9STRA|nr:hypothetical protein PHMEG_00019701 [Phytophthora megakarya]